MDMWERPEYAHLKKQRDESPFVADYDVARPLIELAMAGKPLNEVQRAYVNRFYGSGMCKQFFCRMGFSLEQIPRCWLKGVPTDEQCDRCFASHLIGVTAQEDSRFHLDPRPGTMQVLKSYQGEDGITYFYWEDTQETDRGLVGEFIPGIEIHPRTPLSKVFPLCLPGKGQRFQGCHGKCDECPAFGYLDATKPIVVTGNGTVALTQFPPSLAPVIASYVAECHKEEPLEGNDPSPP